MLKEKKASFSFSGLRHLGLRKAERGGLSVSKTIEVGFPAAGFSFMSPAVTRFSPLSHHLSLEVTLSVASGFKRRFS